MSYKYGTRSQNKLSTCHNALQIVAVEALAISPYDITIIHGWRGELVQDALYDSGASRLRFPNSKHNHSMDPMMEGAELCSDALDFAPWVNGGINWNDTHIFACVAGVFMSVAIDLGYRIRWGGDWDSDGQTRDQTLMDWGHIELVW
jgi:peptidoglycan L-alanyl-D-glutamate endopeptidase CwlK